MFPIKGVEVSFATIERCFHRASRQKLQKTTVHIAKILILKVCDDIKVLKEKVSRWNVIEKSKKNGRTTI